MISTFDKGQPPQSGGWLTAHVRQGPLDLLRVRAAPPAAVRRARSVPDYGEPAGAGEDAKVEVLVILTESGGPLVELDRLRSALGAQLVEQPARMRLHGVLADEQTLGDLTVASPPRSGRGSPARVA